MRWGEVWRGREWFRAMASSVFTSYCLSKIEGRT